MSANQIIETEAQPIFNLAKLQYIEINNHKGIDNLFYNIKIFNSKQNNSIIFQSKIIDDLFEIVYSKEYNIKEINHMEGLKEFSTSEQLFTIFLNNFKDKDLIIFKK